MENQKIKKIAAYTLGCKVNAYDTEAMLELFLNKNYEIVNFDEFSDIYLINTCTVTNLSDKKSRQMIRKAKNNNPAAIIVAVGCYAQVNPEELQKIEGLNLIIGTKDRAEIVHKVENYEKEQGIINSVSNIMDEQVFEKLSVNRLHGKTRALLKIQEGCNQYCSYCIIPYARGNIRSRDPLDVIEETQVLTKNGFKEIVLAGIHVASYGKDLGNVDLLNILEQVHEVENLKRIRFSSIEPTVVTEQFVNTIKSLPKVCDHFHLSLQSGCNKTLKRMNRKYTAEQYEFAVNLLKSSFPNVSITTDIIVGFPGETQNDFHESYNFVKNVGLSNLHIFPYSPKRGTKAALFKDQVPNKIKAERSKKMIKLSEDLDSAFKKKYLNAELQVLFEQKLEGNIYEGHTTNYMKVQVQSQQDLINKIINVKPIFLKGDLLTSKII